MRLLHQRLDHDGGRAADEKPHPTDNEIKDALSTLICRCGTHGAAIRAVKRAAHG